MVLSVLYEDEHYVAIDKPVGILVHRTEISGDTVFLLQQLRRQIGQRVYPVHRLDRGTSGVMVWAKSREAVGPLAALFKRREVEKVYWAIVRGWMPDEGVIDYPIPAGLAPQLQPLPAQTAYRTWSRSETPWAIGNRYATARFSFLHVQPRTGRRHQIRRHLAHLRHPIIGDRRYGDNKHNKFFKEQLGIERLLLHAERLRFRHPLSGVEVHLVAPPDDAFLRALELLHLWPKQETLGREGAQPSPSQYHL